MSNELPSQAYLREALTYDDGRLTWNRRPREHFNSDRACSMWNAKFAGKPAGRQMVGLPYRQVMVSGVRYLEHRVIAAMHGLDTSQVIDHMDGDGLNNRVENLRAASIQENMQNNAGWGKRTARVGTFQKTNGRWTAYIRANGRLKNLGAFGTEAEAIEARLAAEKAVYGRFAVSQSRVVAALSAAQP